jgi:hypothetical protein
MAFSSAYHAGLIRLDTGDISGARTYPEKAHGLTYVSGK